jgi:hypothetical protein
MKAAFYGLVRYYCADIRLFGAEQLAVKNSLCIVRDIHD